MSRRPRIHIPASYHHVILRGNDQEQIFFSDQDRYRFFMLLQEGCEEYKHRIHAFCLMSNHVHLAIQIAEIPISKIIQNVAFRYTQYINKKMHRVGHLFQGRFKSILLDSENYLTTLVRYIHLNPVKAKIVNDPKLYPWSSHRAYLGWENIYWLTTATLLEKFADDDMSPVQNYERFILNEIDDSLNDALFETGLYKGTLLDEKAFLSSILSKPKPIAKNSLTLKNLIQEVCHFYAIHPEELSNSSQARKLSLIRGVIAYFSLITETISLNESAAFCNRDPSTMSCLARRIRNKMKTDSSLANDIKQLENACRLQTSRPDPMLTTSNFKA